MRSNLVGPDALGRLALAEQTQGAVALQHHFGTLRVRVIVDGRHRRTVRPGAAHDDEVADLGLRHEPRRERFWVAWRRCEDIAGLAAGAAEDGLDDVTSGRQHVDRMLRAVERWPRH